MERRNKTALSTQKKLEEKEEKEERKVHSSNQSTTGQGAQITDRSQTDHTHTEQALELTAEMSEAKKGSRELEKQFAKMGWLVVTSKDQLRSIENNTCGTSIQL